MYAQPCGHAGVLSALAFLLALMGSACTPSVQVPQRHAAPLTLSNPTVLSSGPVSLAVGTNHWSKPETGLEEAFLPVAVTVRNTGTQTLCGWVATAVLGDSAGATVSATLPAGVVTRLFGPLAALGPLSPPAVRAATLTGQDSFLLLVHSSSGGHAGGMSPGGRGFSGATPGAPHFGPSPRAFTPSPFSAPLHSPVSPFIPGRQGVPAGGLGQSGSGFPRGVPRPPHVGPSPRVLVPPLFASPFYSPFSPFAPSPFSPFYQPLPPRYPSYPYEYPPYGYGYVPPYGYGYVPPLSPDLPPRGEEPQEVDQALIQEIFTTSFADRPLAPHEERSGFLFFSLPVPEAGTTMLRWAWYECGTRQLVAQLAVPVAVEKKK